jgi:anti-sigma regulatory factor (Ser/Thr protein kinase)
MMDAADLELVAELVVPADVEMLTVCRTTLAGVGAGLALSDAVLDDLKLVLSEVCGAAMERTGSSDGTIDIEFRRSGAEIEISVGDRGGDTPHAAPGLGVAVLRQLCSRLDIGPRPHGRGTIVRFAQTLPA